MVAAFDEMKGTDGAVRPAYGELSRWLGEVPPDVLDYRRREAELLFRRIGITFAVYGDADATERLIPFDVIPRIISAAEWRLVEKGLTQRVKALNLFIKDVYGAREILRAGVVPDDLVFRNPAFRPEMSGQSVPHDIYIHIAGIDIIRVDAETFYVLEDNARTPSGVSYMLENREIMMRLFPELFSRHRIAPVENYPDELLATLKSVAPVERDARADRRAAHARRVQLGLLRALVPCRQARRRTGRGPRPVRARTKPSTCAPRKGRAASTSSTGASTTTSSTPSPSAPIRVLGVPGLMAAYQAGNVTLANAVGTGIADDKAIYSFMPAIMKFYLGEEPLLKTVPTWRCREEEHLAYVLDHLPELVVKEVHGSGGYGMLIGPAASKIAIEQFRVKLKAAPKNFIAQPTLALSTCPTCVEQGVAPRHVDLRPFVLTGRDRVRIVPGGLTRVAMKEGSLVVNSSQGGGTKDTWVLDG